jgi:hypothetical protein
MTADETNPLRHLNATEQDCVRRYGDGLRAQLGDNLGAVYLFGSAARGDMWSARFPIHSDINVVLLVQEAISFERRITQQHCPCSPSATWIGWSSAHIEKHVRIGWWKSASRLIGIAARDVCTCLDLKKNDIISVIELTAHCE